MNANYVERYEIVRRDLFEWQLCKAVSKIKDSNRFEFGELTYIILKNTRTPIAYIGSETLELCFPKGEKSELFKIPHSHLRRIFNSI